MDAAQNPPGLFTRWREFFHAEEVPYGLALIRICLPLALLAAALPRWPYARELYSQDGAAAPLWESFQYPGLLPIPSGPLAVALATLWVLSLTTLSIGWMSRTSAAISMVLTAYLGMLDLLSTLTKFTCIATHLLLLLSLSHCGSLWSIDAWLERRPQRWPGELDGGYRRYPAWPRRLVQWLIAIVYFGAAITKMQTPHYFTGDQLYFWLITNVSAANPVGEYLSLWPSLLVVMALVTIVWETTFPFICWRGWLKCGALLMGLLFHVLTVLMLGLVVFPLVYLSAYWAFFDSADIRDLARWLRRQRRRLPSWSAAFATLWQRPWTPPAWATPGVSACGFVGGTALLIAVGLQVEYHLDIYGQRRPAGPHQLTPLDPEHVKRMLAGEESVDKKDQVLGFDVGSRMLGGMLANRQTVFRIGERAVVECAITPPHADLWLEANLHDARNRLVQRCGQVLIRERLRSHFIYDWTEMYPPGEYDLVLQIDGQEVTRRRVTLTNGSSSPATAATAMAR